MKNINKLGMATIILGALLTLVNTVSAATIGANYNILGFEAGWILIILGIVVIVIFASGVLAIGKKGAGNKSAYSIAVAMLMIGLALTFVTVEDTVTGDVTGLVSGWEVTGTDTTAGCTIDATWDDTDDPTIITAPLNHDNAGAGTNTFDETTFVVYFTVDPIAGLGADTTKLVTIHYKTEYNMEYGGEPVLEKSGSNYVANWTNEDGVTAYYEGSMDMTLDEVNWMSIYFDIDGDGNTTVGETLDTVGETTSWTITLWDDYGWIDTYTVMLVVITSD